MAAQIFVPLVASRFGASPVLIGLLVAGYNLAFFFSSYFFGLCADRWGGRLILRGGLLIAAVVCAAQFFAVNLSSLFFWRVLAGLALGIFPAALAVYAYAEQGGRMGRFSGYGSLGWALGALIAGLIANYQVAFLLSGIFLFFAFLTSLRLPEAASRSAKLSLFPRELVRRNLRIYLPYFFRSLGAQATWSIFPLYLLFSGADKFWVGIAYFVNTGAQSLIMPAVEKHHNLYLVNIGLLLTVVTFGGYALFPYLPVVLILQLLLAISFSTLQVGALQELLEKNLEQSTAVSLLNSIINLTAVIGPFLAGFVLEVAGFSGVMWGAALLSFAGLLLFTTVLE